MEKSTAGAAMLSISVEQSCVGVIGRPCLDERVSTELWKYVRILIRFILAEQVSRLRRHLERFHLASVQTKEETPIFRLPLPLSPIAFDLSLRHTITDALGKWDMQIWSFN